MVVVVVEEKVPRHHERNLSRTGSSWGSVRVIFVRFFRLPFISIHTVLDIVSVWL